MKLKGKRLWHRGVCYSVDVEAFRAGDGEAHNAGYIERGEGVRRIVVDTLHQDDSTLAHEIGHAVCDEAGVYLSENQMLVFEDLFPLCRDPRNAWLAEYLFGRPLAPKGGKRT